MSVKNYTSFAAVQFYHLTFSSYFDTMSGAGRRHYSRHICQEMEESSLQEFDSSESFFAICVHCLGNNEWLMHIPALQTDDRAGVPSDIRIIGKIPRKMHKLVWIQRGDVVQIDRKSVLLSIAASKVSSEYHETGDFKGKQSFMQKASPWQSMNAEHCADVKAKNAPGTHAAHGHFVMIDRKITEKQLRRFQEDSKSRTNDTRYELNDSSVAMIKDSLSVSRDTMLLLAWANAGLRGDRGPERSYREKKVVMNGNHSMGWILTDSEEDSEESDE